MNLKLKKLLRKGKTEILKLFEQTNMVSVGKMIRSFYKASLKRVRLFFAYKK